MKYGILCWFCLNAVCVKAQSFRYKTYSTKDGLSSNIVLYAVKDDSGFLWIATGNGLNRFDGNAFDHFFNNPADSTSIASNEINNVFIDSKKNLWVTTMAGLSLYHSPTQTFSNYAPDTLVMPTIGHLYPAIAEDHYGKIWLGGWYDLLLFDTATKKFTSSGWSTFADKVKPANGNHSRVVVLGIQPKSTHEFWVLTTYGLFSVHTKNLQFRFHPFTEVKDYYGCQLNYVEKDGSVWIGTYNNGIISYNPGNDKWTRFTTPVEYRVHAGWDWAYGITQFSGDTLMYCSQKTVLFLLRGQSIITNKLLNETGSLNAGSYLYNIIKNGNNYWLLSGAGITKMYPAKEIFTLVKNPGLRMVGKIFPLQEPGTFITGNDSAKRVFMFDEQKNKVELVVEENGQPLKAYLSSFKIVNNETSLLCTDENLYRYNRLTNTATLVPLPSNRFANNPRWVRNIVTDHKQKAWIRLRRQGIVEYDLKKNTAEYLSIIPQKEQTTFCSMYFDTVANELWVGVENQGMYLYNTITKKTTHYLFNIAPSQKGATINALCGGVKGILYASDVNYGLFAINTVTKKFVRYTAYDGLANNNGNFICKDAAGNIWISHTEGISRFDTVSKIFSNYPELKEAAVYASFLNTDEKGNVLLPSPEGFYRWNVNSFAGSKPVGKLYTRNVFTPEHSLPINDVYDFPPGQNNIGFQFGYLLFDDEGPDDHRVIFLQYQLNKGEWVNLKNENTISFSTLAPDKYVLNVREKNNPSQVLTIRFIIHPPFYKTWWFLLASGLFCAGMVFFLFKRRLASVKKRAAFKQKIAETEMMALRAQMNPHFIFNCISSIDNFILDNDKDNASSYLNKFAKLIRNILDNSINEVIPFWKDWETIKLYLELEQLRSNGRFSYSLHADEDLLNGHYKIPPLIIQPYIENAIHHGLNALTGKAGILTIEARLKGQALEYSIQDNGIGRKKAAEKASLSPSHQSYGLQLTQERIGLFNEQKENNVLIADQYDNNGAPAGTRVAVVLKKI